MGFGLCGQTVRSHEITGRHCCNEVAASCAITGVGGRIRWQGNWQQLCGGRRRSWLPFVSLRSDDLLDFFLVQNFCQVTLMNIRSRDIHVVAGLMESCGLHLQKVVEMGSVPATKITVTLLESARPITNSLKSILAACSSVTW